jgi:hypothetical protein
MFVLVSGQLEQRVAAQPGTFTPKADLLTLVPEPLPTLDPLVDLAKDGLVGGQAPLKLVIHGQ